MTTLKPKQLLVAAVSLAMLLAAPAIAASSAEDLFLAKALLAKEVEFEELEDAELYIVYSETDQDAQIVTAVGAEEGLRRIFVFGPEGRLFQNLRLNDGGDLGQVDAQFETPEPSLEELEEAYPEGEYLFVGITVEGSLLVSEAELSHDLLDAPMITFPGEGDEDIPVAGFTATWDPVDGAEGYRVELEDEEEEIAIKADVAGDATSFTFPPGWLVPSTEYTLDVKAFGENGNRSVTDLRFTTEE